MFKRRVIIISGLGTTGRPVFERLRARCVEAIPVSRTTRPAFDWSDRTTWPGALRGATAAYVTYPPGLGSPAAAEDVGLLAGIAADMGIEHIVLLSIRDKRRVLRAEQRLRAAPLDHTILRAGPLANGGADAVADCAVAALCDPAHLNRTYDVGRGGDGVPLRGAPGDHRPWGDPRPVALRVEPEPSHSS